MKNLLPVFILIIIPFLSNGQELISGLVVDSASFAPLPYVNITIKNNNKGTITDSNGNFKIVASERDTLLFSFVGYHTIELPVLNWEPSMILLAEKATMLKSITIEDRRIDPYSGLFDDENALLEKQNKKLPFYYSRTKKQKIKVNRLAAENLRTRIYVEVVIQNQQTKERLMNQYKLNEKEYYDLLGEFNALNYTVMYYLTAGELMSLLNRFFEQRAGKK